MSVENATNTSLAESSPDPRVWVEPSPNWVTTLNTLKWMWYAHVYGFGASFLVLALCSLVSLVVLFRSGRRRSRAHFIVISLLLFHLGAIRGILLLWDPYISSGNDSKSVVLLCVISWGAAKACLTSAFSIMLLIFLETTRIDVGPPRCRNLPFFVVVTLINIAYLTLSDIVAVFCPVAKLMVLVCQVTFSGWGLVVCLGYFIGAKRMRDNLLSSQNAAGNLFLDIETRRLKRLHRLMLTASAFGAANFLVSIYIASDSKQGVLSEIGQVDSWTWFATQTGLRALELLMSLSLMLVALNNVRKREQVTPSQASWTAKSVSAKVNELEVQVVKNE